ncbi:TetR/AcrR family transcriptional regulator [Iamia sp. SCSIO 61187]|uniref:TetR/AcrR family transcriptional regulator n=1 Tax=Iamia sp. SCSIO 61187 TaxID=2722752 RepID=UPI001C63A08E|nr:TetR/AcrR family transcriptional regulator [Iamia sp. SCSIO 61187]QYG91686.1 TetR/AcrR family transcriptional regulator [Iamia sp. SCSIO 61187]
MAPTSTRDRIVDAGAALFLHQGYVGTGMKQIVAASGAPFGSVYHHFPGGKEELGVAAVHRAGAAYAELVGATLDEHDDIVEATAASFAAAGDHLRASGWADACPIATVALEVAGTSEPLRQACAEVFEGWTAALTDRFAAAGVPADRARPLALTFLMLLEGGFLFGRTARTTEALDAAGPAAVAAVRAALSR